MPNYTYTTNIPLGSDNPSDSAPEFNTNFTSTASLVNIDLYGFNNNNGGTHQQVTFPVASPVPSPTGTVGVLYSVLDAFSKSQLWFANSAGTNQITPLPDSPSVTSSANAGTAGGTIYALSFRGGFVIYMGTTAGLARNTTYTVIFPVPYSLIYTSGTTTNVGTGAANAASCVQSNTTLFVIQEGVNLGINWFAIGKL